jgi:large subunit ribosomal protein L7/L12
MDIFTNDEVIDTLGKLTVLELIALTKQLEKKWNLKAIPQLVVSEPIQEQVETVVQTEFDVVFVSFPADKKMTMVKLVRETLGLGLLESKALVESLPKTLKEALPKVEAEILKARFAELDAVVELK